MSAPTASAATSAQTFNKPRHIKYWLRCARTFLPHPYQSADASRMLLAFFTVAALDLLGALDSVVTAAERRAWIDWVYGCQVPEGGFRGFTGTDLGRGWRNVWNLGWDAASVPGTFLALCTLGMLGDGFERVRWRELRGWLGRCQRGDGSFGEMLGVEGRIEGGDDLRFCYCAVGIAVLCERWSGVEEGGVMWEALERYVRGCQTFEGGFSQGPHREAHSGLTYCAVGALSLLKQSATNGSLSAQDGLLPSDDLESLLGWLVRRQTTYIEDSDDDDEEGQESASQEATEGVTDKANGMTAPSLNDVHSLLSATNIDTVGFNGRVNKIADTCYCWWNLGSLAMLGKIDLVDADGIRRYLVEKVQHVIGGFGKGIDEPPDILHSYLGLASLSALGHPDLKPVNPEFAISADAARRLLAMRETR